MALQSLLVKINCIGEIGPVSTYARFAMLSVVARVEGVVREIDQIYEMLMTGGMAPPTINLTDSM